MSKASAEILAHGCAIGSFEVVYLASDKRLGEWALLRAGRQEIEVRVTPSGLLRVGKPRPAGRIRAGGAI